MYTRKRFPSSVYFSVTQRKSHRPVRLIFLPFIYRLRFLEIYIDFSSGTDRDFRVLSSLIGSLSTSLASPERLEFNFQFHGNNQFNPNTFYVNLRNVWSPLELIATHPNGFESPLQRVDIKINYVTYCKHGDGEEPDKDKFLEAVHDGLPLLHAKGILFVEAVIKKWPASPGW